MLPSSSAALARTSWELEQESDLDSAFAHYESIGCRPAWVDRRECDELRLQRAFRIKDPVIGAEWEYYSQMTGLSAPRSNRLTSFQGGKHFGMVVPQCVAMTDFAVEKMGFLVSDYFEGNGLSLLRAWPNPNHHSCAFVQTTGPARLHHVAFMVDSIDDIGRMLNRTRKFGVQVQWGIGRHPTSGSIHLYVYGPDWFVWEYTFGMEQFPESGARAPRRFSTDPEEFDLWDAVPDHSHSADMPRVITAPPGGP
jgi:2,3-dihydroxy-p-cumate/2,3-dihydroxybenzoate 3,4-dioxygenase